MSEPVVDDLYHNLCGHDVPKGVKYCPECGAEVVNITFNQRVKLLEERVNDLQATVDQLANSEETFPKSEKFTIHFNHDHLYPAICDVNTFCWNVNLPGKINKVFLKEGDLVPSDKSVFETIQEIDEEEFGRPIPYMFVINSLNIPTSVGYMGKEQARWSGKRFSKFWQERESMKDGTRYKVLKMHISPGDRIEMGDPVLDVERFI